MDIQQIKDRYNIIGDDPRLMLALSKAVQVAPTNLSILITGESGVGKDVFSHIIHDNSLQRNAKKGQGLVSVNCGAIPEGTIESELFGHVKGAYTGADKDRKGYFEEAHDGTIFLDEVGELPLSTQVKLLRVLENGEITPVGASLPRKVNVRVVAATNIDILKAVREGKFREDLYYRLNQISIYIPPLRERKEDIPLLFRKFAADVAERYGMIPIRLTEDGKEYLKNYPWYGNIRELKNITEQIAVVEQERNISKAILLSYLQYVPEEKMPALVSTTSQTADTISDRELLLKALSMGQMINELRNEIQDLRTLVATMAGGKLDTLHIDNSNAVIATAAGAAPEITHLQVHKPSGHLQPTWDEEIQESEVIDDEPLALTSRERTAIIKALARHNGKRKLAAAELGISERTLYRKIKDYDIDA
ncbi:MAG: sigma-54-dependent Fis family transcriptional regulator [Bacteroidales bacterium]|nr:sigma-54-dependent Fis family transcriptional regulator [Bacteroidales bacterium]MBQ9474138.1 sigma-54-dependent Fis family transcriptional regulator [Bacteroidales bacterium]